jgi:hypothetical protein
MNACFEIAASRHGAAYAVVSAADTFAIDAAAAFNLRAYRHAVCPVRGAIVCFVGTPRELRAFAEYCE